MHTVSGPLGLRRVERMVEIRTLPFWAPHVDVFLEQRCLESNVVKMQARKNTPSRYTYNSS